MSNNEDDEILDIPDNSFNQFDDQGMGPLDTDSSADALDNMYDQFDNPQGDELGKWRFEYAMLIKSLIEQFTGEHRKQATPEELDKYPTGYKRIKSRNRMICDEGALQVITLLTGLMHKGTNLSIFTRDEINDRCKNIEIALNIKFYVNRKIWKVKKHNADQIINIIILNVESILRKATDGRELEMSYKASSYAESAQRKDDMDIQPDIPQHGLLGMFKRRR